MILKLLLIAGVIALVYFIFFKTKPLNSSTDKHNNKADKKNDKNANEMIECSTCGVYSELSECILSNGKYYCSSECASKAV
jgi:uncharacterized protein